MNLSSLGLRSLNLLISSDKLNKKGNHHETDTKNYPGIIYRPG